VGRLTLSGLCVKPLINDEDASIYLLNVNCCVIVVGHALIGSSNECGNDGSGREAWIAVNHGR